MRTINERAQQTQPEPKDTTPAVLLALQSISDHLERLTEATTACGLSLKDISKRMRRKKSVPEESLQQASHAYVDSKLHTSPETMMELVRAVQNRHAIDSKALKALEAKHLLVLSKVQELSNNLAAFYQNKDGVLNRSPAEVFRDIKNRLHNVLSEDVMERSPTESMPPDVERHGPAGASVV